MLRKLDLLADPSRLGGVTAVLSDTHGSNSDYDRLARLTAGALETPTSLITLIDETHQHFHGICGAPGGMGEARDGPHTDSLCLHTVLTGALVSITDTGADPRFSENPLVKSLGIKAYLGMPLVNHLGHTMGSICAIDYTPREWTDGQVSLLRDFAAVTSSHLDAEIDNVKIRSAFDVALHDIKTPLAGLTMASALVSERIDSVPKELHPLLQVVRESTEAAVKLVDILATEQKRKSSKRCEQPLEIASHVVSKFSPPAMDKGMAVTLAARHSAALEVPDWVLAQVLENLVSNAVKYGPSGSEVMVTFLVEDGAGHFHIRDEGPGFTKEDRQKMYRRYATLSATPTGGEKSTGIGLSVVKLLTAEHSGTVTLISEPGSATEFRVSFPVAR